MSANQEHFNIFFKDPYEEPELPGICGVLYLLRRDIIVCFDKKIATWPATMAILAGIDLLGKFYAGKDGPGVRQRFKDFVEEYFHISREDAETIFQLRNALMHSFGLYSEGRRFSLINNETDPLIQRPFDDKYTIINIRALKKEFEAAIGRYQADIQADDELRGKFSGEMYSRYGTIHISKA
jgi:hypothetical protein